MKTVILEGGPCHGETLDIEWWDRIKVRGAAGLQRGEYRRTSRTQGDMEVWEFMGWISRDFYAGGPA